MEHLRFELPTVVAHVVFTSANDGDFRVNHPPGSDDARRVEARRRAVTPNPWTSLRQVHGSEVAVVGEPGEHDQAEADGAVTFRTGCAIAVTTADCAPVVLIGSCGIAVVHAGWRGAALGIVPVAADLLRSGGAEPVATIVGPCIQPAAYEFGTEELDDLATRFGEGLRASTADGGPALDLHALITTTTMDGGWPAPARSICTSDVSYFSHRTRSDRGRQATVAWLTSKDRGQP